LSEIMIPYGVKKIGKCAFRACCFQNFRIPPLVAKVDLVEMGLTYSNIVSLELSEHVSQLSQKDRHTMDFLRNIAVPKGCSSIVLVGCKDLLTVFPGEDIEQVKHALQSRFDELPIHKICYYQPFHAVCTVMSSLKCNINPWSTKFGGKLNETGNQTDCLGMTPLHILACSTKHDVAMYRLLIDNFPENVTAKDKWGALPILYAFWVNAPSTITQFLVEKHKTLFPDYVLDWAGMLEILVQSHVPIGNIQNLLNVKQSSFPDQSCSVKDLVMKLAKADTSRCKYDRCNISIKVFKYLLQASISKRLDTLDEKRWSVQIQTSINQLPNTVSTCEENTLEIYTKLASYEIAKEGTTLLELALWKAKIGEFLSTGQVCHHTNTQVEAEINRHRCHINCGADIVVRNVLHFLEPQQIHKTGDESDSIFSPYYDSEDDDLFEFNSAFDDYDSGDDLSLDSMRRRWLEN